MKKLILTTVVAMTSLSLFAQGTIIFQNFQAPATFKSVDWAPGEAMTGGIDNSFQVGLWFAAVGTTDRAQFTAGPVLRAGSPAAGFVNSGAGIALPGAGFESADVFVRAWQGDATWDDTVAGGVYVGGESDIWTQALGGGGTPAAPPQSTAPGWQTFTVATVPEPSVIALGLLGAGALLLLRRRK